MHCTGYGGSSNTRGVSLAVLKWIDTDGDGVHNDHDSDDDGDGMPDTWENANGLDPLTANANGDPDGDGDGNLTEYNNGTDPQDHETPRLLRASLSKSRIYDTESTTFSWDSEYATSCRDVWISTTPEGASANAVWGSSGSATFKGSEFTPGTHTYEFHCSGGGKDSARKTIRLTVTKWIDTDGDGVHNDYDSDDDGDGMPDTWENANGLDPLAANANGDPDGDGDGNLTEYNNGTDPQDHETPQVLRASLSKSRIYDNESVTFTWDSKYATSCRDVWISTVSGGASANAVRGPSGSVAYRGSDFASGTHTYEFYCSGGGKDSARKTVTLTVAAWTDTDSDGIHNDQDSDDDGDGMPDTWENANGLDPLADDTAGDPDKDGDNNLTEYDNGTDPQKHEVARLTGFRLAADTIHTNGTAVFHWNSRYATTCRFAGDEAEKDLGTAGPLSSEPGDFTAGTWEIAMICEGPGGASPQQTVTLKVLPWIDSNNNGIHDDEEEDDADSGGDAGFTADYELYTVTTSVPNPGGEETVDLENLVVKKAKGGSRAGPADFAMRESHGCASFSLSSLDASWLAHAGKETPLSRDAVIGDYNHDGYDDLAIEGLAGTAFPGMDRVVFARPNRSNYLPNRAAALDADARDFFGGLAGWIASPGDFGDDFDVSVGVDEGAQIQGGAAAGSKPRLTINVKSHELVAPDSDAAHTDPNAPPPTAAYPSECFGRSTHCQFVFVPKGAESVRLELSAAQFPGAAHFSEGSGAKAAGGENVLLVFGIPVNLANSGWVVLKFAYDWIWSDRDDPVPPGRRDAALLWETVLRPLGATGKIDAGSPEAVLADGLLSGYLGGAEVFGGVLRDAGLKRLPEAVAQTGADKRVGALGDILETLEHVRARLALPTLEPVRVAPPPGTVKCEGSHCIPVGCDADGNCLNEACGASASSETVQSCLAEAAIAELCEAGKRQPQPQPGGKVDPRYEKFCAEDGTPKGIDLIAIPRCSIQISVSPDADHFEISRANPPVMPTITGTAAAAAPGAGDPAPEISWWAQVTHTAPTGCVANGDVNSPVDDTGWLPAADNRTFSPDFDGMFGGDFKLVASCRDPNRSNLSYAGASAEFGGEIWGRQPTARDIVEAVETAAVNENEKGEKYFKRMIVGRNLGTGITSEPVAAVLKKIACHESHSSQFYESAGDGILPAIGGLRTIGMPVYGGGGDVGIMQICYRRAPAHVWNWVANVNYGAELFRSNLESFAYEHLVLQVKPVLGLADKTDEQLTNEERLQIRAEMRKYIREEAIHRYNAGGGPDDDGDTLTMYWRWNSETGLLDPVDLKDDDVNGYVSSVDGETTASCSLL